MGKRGRVVVGPLGGMLVAGLGVFSWTFAEYVAHRWLMHGGRGRRLVSREHRAHHARPEATDAKRRAVGYAAVILPVATGVAVARRRLWPLAVGWAVGYAGYEQFHWREHHRSPLVGSPLARWEREARRRHFAHHFVAARANFGVTTSLWDRMFRTARPMDVVPVPTHLAMNWLLDGSGDVRAEFTADYALVDRHATAAR